MELDRQEGARAFYRTHNWAQFIVQRTSRLYYDIKMGSRDSAWSFDARAFREAAALFTALAEELEGPTKPAPIPYHFLGKDAEDITQ